MQWWLGTWMISLSSSSPRFMCSAWPDHYMVWNISMVSHGQLSQLCPLLTPCAPSGCWGDMRCRKGLDSLHALLSIAITTLLSSLFPAQVQNTAPRFYKKRLSTLPQTKTAQDFSLHIQLDSHINILHWNPSYHILNFWYLSTSFSSKEHIQTKKMLFMQYQSKREQLFKMTYHLFFKGVRLEEAFGDGFVVVWHDLQRLQSILQLY